MISSTRLSDRSEADDLDAAIAAISDPARLRQAQDLIARVAPGLQRVLAGAIADGGWFDTAHGAALGEAVALEDPQQRLRVVDSLIAEETRLAMLVGAAVGFELARELDRGCDPETNTED
ncbi:MAG: hypothetical protein ACLP8S_26030 [Solirubrobacteraceae bacterium]